MPSPSVRAVLASVLVLAVPGCAGPGFGDGRLVDLSHAYAPDTVYWPTDRRGFEYETLAAGVTSQASEVYNTMVHSFTPTQLRGIVFLAGPATFAEDGGARYGEQMTALANAWKSRFGGQDPHFLYTLPDKSLAPKLTQPKDIRGRSTAIPTSDWTEISNLLDALK